MSAQPTLVIVGASLAGAKAAEGARAAGFEGRVVLVGDEPGFPYERPPLSKAVLRGEVEAEAARVHQAGFYAEHTIELVHDEVTTLDPVAMRVRLASGEHVPFTSLVLATGASPRRLQVPGSGLDGVHVLRTLDDSRSLHHAITRVAARSGRVLVVGAGWIGSEVAASARQMGADVTLVDPAPTPLHRLVGSQLGAMFFDLQADHGVRMRMGATVRELRGDGRVEQVLLADGRVEDADLVVAGIGVRPRVDLVEPALGIRVDGGVVVDEHLETTVPGIFAAGDVANAWHPRLRRHLRVEHWANALHQGLAAGRNAAGAREVYERLPYFFSDQYDLSLEHVGHTSDGDAIVIRGKLGDRDLIAFWHDDGVVHAAMAVNVWDVVDDLKAIIERDAPVDLRRLTSPDVPLAEVSGVRAPRG